MQKTPHKNHTAARKSAVHSAKGVRETVAWCRLAPGSCPLPAHCPRPQARTQGTTPQDPGRPRSPPLPWRAVPQGQGEPGSSPAADFCVNVEQGSSEQVTSSRAEDGCRVEDGCGERRSCGAAAAPGPSPPCGARVAPREEPPTPHFCALCPHSTAHLRGPPPCPRSGCCQLFIFIYLFYFILFFKANTAE